MIEHTIRLLPMEKEELMIGDVNDRVVVDSIVIKLSRTTMKEIEIDSDRIAEIIKQIFV